MNALDAYRCAKLLLDQHGSGAELQAAMRADAFEAAGDEAGQAGLDADPGSHG